MVAARGGRAADAARLFGASAALREALGRPLGAPGRPSRRDYAYAEPTDLAGHIDEARAALDAAAFKVAWAEGRAMPVEQAIGIVVETVRRSIPS